MNKFRVALLLALVVGGFGAGPPIPLLQRLAEV